MTFDQFFRMKRIKTGLSMRQFCIKHNYDSGNISKIETGITAGPINHTKLMNYAKALNLKYQETELFTKLAKQSQIKRLQDRIEKLQKQIEDLK